MAKQRVKTKTKTTKFRVKKSFGSKASKSSGGHKHPCCSKKKGK